MKLALFHFPKLCTRLIFHEFYPWKFTVPILTIHIRKNEKKKLLFNLHVQMYFENSWCLRHISVLCLDENNRLEIGCMYTYAIWYDWRCDNDITVTHSDFHLSLDVVYFIVIVIIINVLCLCVAFGLCIDRDRLDSILIETLHVSSSTFTWYIFGCHRHIHTLSPTHTHTHTHCS